jgi:hypothetical protein
MTSTTEGRQCSTITIITTITISLAMVGLPMITVTAASAITNMVRSGSGDGSIDVFTASAVDSSSPTSGAAHWPSPCWAA